jgi:hypothetical protein
MPAEKVASDVCNWMNPLVALECHEMMRFLIHLCQKPTLISVQICWHWVVWNLTVTVGANGHRFSHFHHYFEAGQGIVDEIVDVTVELKW